MLRILFCAALLLVSCASRSEAELIVTRWNFNSSSADGNPATGTLTPYIGSGTASTLGTTASFADGTGSTDSGSDNSAWNITGFATQSQLNNLRGVQFLLSTAGFNSISIHWDTFHSSQSARHQRFQYTVDGGSNWLNTPTPSIFAASSGDAWFNNRTVDLTGLAGVDNNPNFGIRMVATFTPTLTTYGSSADGTSLIYSPAGQWRFDMVTVTAVPEPAAVLLVGNLIVVGMFHRRRVCGAA